MPISFTIESVGNNRYKFTDTSTLVGLPGNPTQFIYRYWDWGDGSTRDNSEPPIPNVVYHTFPSQGGNFNVRLVKVTDYDDEAYLEAQQNLTVESIIQEPVAPQDMPINFAIKFADVNVNRAIQVEPNKRTTILINLTKNIITPVR